MFLHEICHHYLTTRQRSLTTCHRRLTARHRAMTDSPGRSVLGVAMALLQWGSSFVARFSIDSAPCLAGRR